MTVPGQVDSQQWPSETQRHGVPRVRVLGSTVDEHRLHRFGTPSKRTDHSRHHHRRIVTIGHVGGDPGDGWQLGHHEPELVDVLLEQTELVVGAHEFTMTRSPAVRQRGTAAARPSGQGAGTNGEGTAVVEEEVAVVVVAFAGGLVVAGASVVDGGVVVVVVVVVVVLLVVVE